jgi:hypothetical protein
MNKLQPPPTSTDLTKPEKDELLLIFQNISEGRQQISTNQLYTLLTRISHNYHSNRLQLQIRYLSQEFYHDNHRR